ncbi:MAG: hypothetical protein IJD52_05110 [Alphaproteobacteria bacterium]|nr:hypothetical protein [Alphaproteobacteria bacterium]
MKRSGINPSAATKIQTAHVAVLIFVVFVKILLYTECESVGMQVRDLENPNQRGI